MYYMLDCQSKVFNNGKLYDVCECFKHTRQNTNCMELHTYVLDLLKHHELKLDRIFIMLTIQMIFANALT